MSNVGRSSRYHPANRPRSGTPVPGEGTRTPTQPQTGRADAQQRPLNLTVSRTRVSRGTQCAQGLVELVRGAEQLQIGPGASRNEHKKDAGSQCALMKDRACPSWGPLEEKAEEEDLESFFKEEGM